LKNWQSQIKNQKWLGWLTRPGSQQLGAKWVGVTKRQAGGISYRMTRANLKTWPATPVGTALETPALALSHTLSESLPFNKEAAGVGQPFRGLPI